MTTPLDKIKAGVALAALGAVAYVGWRAYKAGTGTLADVKQAIAQGAANLESGFANYVGQPFMDGMRWAATGDTPYVGEKAFLYSDANYTGMDPQTGQPIINGEWYGNAEARRYTAQQIDAGAAPAATSINGAAFGIYPSAAGNNTISAAAANAARRLFAATDPRRIDL